MTELEGSGGRGAGGHSKEDPDSEALLNAVRPFCMSAMLALESMLATEQTENGASPGDAAAAARVIAGRRLQSSLSSLHTTLDGVMSRLPAARLGLHEALPLVMLPLQLALSPPRRGAGGKEGQQMPAGVREKGFLCVAAVIRGSGSRFVEGYGARPTTNILIGLVFILSEISPSTPPSTPLLPASGSGVGDSVSFAGRAASEGRGLTAGTEALRLACLQCLEIFLRAPFDSGSHPRSTAAAHESAWSEVRNVLRTAAQGGVMAQLVQELLRCCQGAIPPDAGKDFEDGRRRRWGGPEEARAAAGCLDALCSFASGTSLWRRFLPGTFSGLFRAIRGLNVGARGGRMAPSALQSIPLASTVGVPGEGTRGSERAQGGAASKSSLARACLEILAKVLLMCAGDSDASPVEGEPSRKPSFPEKTNGSFRDHMSPKQSGGSAINSAASEDGGDSLQILRQLAATSNAQAETTGGSTGDSSPSTSSIFTSVAFRANGAAPATADVSEDAAWEAQTSGRLCVLLPALLAFCRLHPAWRLRHASVRFASALLTHAYGGAEGTGGPTEDGGDSPGGAQENGLLAPLVPLLVEALVGLAMDGMPQVSSAAREALSQFRSSLHSFRWLALRSTLLERLLAIVEGLPALAKAADEKRIRGAFDLLSGYLSLLGFDARLALDARLSAVLSSLCEVLEFDQDFNVQVLEGSFDGRDGSNKDSVREDASPSSGGAVPKYYRRVFANVREDSTLASARRATRLLGTYCDFASLADATLCALETSYPRPMPTRSQGRRASRPVHESGSGSQLAQAAHSRAAADGPSVYDRKGVYRRRCLEWLRLRLPMAWVLNQALLGQGTRPTQDPSAANVNGEGSSEGGGNLEAARDRDPLPRALAVALLERLLASQAFALQLTRDSTRIAQEAPRDSSRHQSALTTKTIGLSGREVAGYTRSGAAVGGAGGARADDVSGQVLDANANLVSTIVETLASLAEASGPDFHEGFLRRALYPLLEKAASPHPVVSQAALASLWRVGAASGQHVNSLSQLLEGNMDYIVDDFIRSVALASRRREVIGSNRVDAVRGGEIGTGGSIPSVVEVVLRIGGKAMGPALVKDLAGVTLREVDACAWDPLQTRQSLRLLHAVASCVSVTPLPAEANEASSPNFSQATGGDLPPELANSPWFRHLFVEFADSKDVQRIEARSGHAAEGLLRARNEHLKATNDVLSNEELYGASGDMEEGIVNGDEAGNDSLPEPDAEGRKIADSQEVKTLSEVLSRCCHYLATPALRTQALALACMRDCVSKLASTGADAALLPHVHRAWRPLMSVFREHLTPLPKSPAGQANDAFEESLSARRSILLHALDTIDILVAACGDFLSTKVAEDLWPLLKLLLLQYKTWTAARGGRSTSMVVGGLSGNSSSALGSFVPSGTTSVLSNGSQADTQADSIPLLPMSSLSLATTYMSGRSDGGSARSVESRSRLGNVRVSLSEKVIARALECIDTLCNSEECQRYMAPLAREVALAALSCLSCNLPDTIRSPAEKLFGSLSYLDGDGVWLLLLQTLDAAGRADLCSRRTPAQERHRPVSLSDGHETGKAGSSATISSSLAPSGDAGGGLTAASQVLPLPPKPAASSLAECRPAPLLEGRTVFDGGAIALDCAPLARRLLQALNKLGHLAEHD